MKIQLVCFFVLVNLSSCSRVQGYFPDKEKDYQLTTEIPNLIVPADLSDKAISSEAKAPEVVYQLQESAITEPENNADETKAVYVELVQFSGGATRIRVEDSLARMWRTVGKALSRQSIEIIARNEIDSVYFVRYDPDFKEVEDGSLWDEAMFIFGSDPAKDQEFRVRLVENGGLTEVLVLNNKDIPLSKGDGLKLLDLLYKTIKQDLADVD